MFYKIFAAFAILTVTDYRCPLVSNFNGFQVCANQLVRGNDWKDMVLSINERDKLELFRARVQDKLPELYMHTDFYLIRWLRARYMNIDNAESMLLENLRWRLENRIKTILTENFSDVSSEYPLLTDGYDRAGRPFGVVFFGLWDLRGAVLRGNLRRVNRYMDYFQENLVHQIVEAREAGGQVMRTVVVVDMEGFNFVQQACPSCIQVFIRMVVGMETHYPGFWEEIIIINAPRIFGLLLEAVKGILSERTRECLKVFDTNKRKWVAYLDERIEKDQRYPNHGGTRIKD